MPTTHTTTVSQEKLVLLYVIVRGLLIDVSRIIAIKIRDCAVKTHRTAALLFSLFITSICVVFGVRLDARDDHIRNNGAFTARTIERVVGESAGTTTEPAVVIGARRAIGLEQTIQALNTSITNVLKLSKGKTIGFGVIYSTWTTNYTNSLYTWNALTGTSLTHWSSNTILSTTPQDLHQKLVKKPLPQMNQKKKL